jgi:hypothetical protein
MLHVSIRRLVLLAGLSFALLAAPASARVPGWDLAAEMGRSAWAWLAGAFPGRFAEAPKLGCRIDPDGRQVCGPAPTQPSSLKHGCSINPDGTPRCTP